MEDPRPPRANRFEILGAWLRIWTPPRDVEIPPIPWRKVAVGVVLLALAGVAVAVFVAPEIDEGKKEREARETAARERRQAEIRDEIRRDQRPRYGDLPAQATRAEAITAVGAVIGRDARERFDEDAKPATCEPVPGADATADRVLYDCFAKVRDIIGGGEQEGAVGALSIPYRARILYADDRYAYCRIHPRPGEQWITDPRDAVLMPKICSVYRGG